MLCESRVWAYICLYRVGRWEAEGRRKCTGKEDLRIYAFKQSQNFGFIPASLRAELYIGLVCVQHVYVIELKAWTLDAKKWYESNTIKFYIYSNILLNYNRKWEKWRVCVFVSSFIGTYSNMPRHMYQTQQSKQEMIWNIFIGEQERKPINISFIICTDTRCAELCWCQINWWSFLCFRVFPCACALTVARILVKWVELICFYCLMKWCAFSQLKCDKYRAKAVKCARNKNRMRKKK